MLARPAVLASCVLFVGASLPLAVAEDPPNVGAVRVLGGPTTEIDALGVSYCIQARYCAGGVFVYVPSTGQSEVRYGGGAYGPLDTVGVGVLDQEASVHLPFCPGENPNIIMQCVGDHHGGGSFTGWRPNLRGPGEVIVGYVGNGATSFTFSVRNGTVLGRSDGHGTTYRMTDLHGVDATVGDPNVAVAAQHSWEAARGGLLLYWTPFYHLVTTHATPEGLGPLCEQNCEAGVVGPPGTYRFITAVAPDVTGFARVVFADIPPP